MLDKGSALVEIAVKRSPLLGHSAIITNHMILVVEVRCATSLGIKFMSYKNYKEFQNMSNVMHFKDSNPIRYCYTHMPRE